MENKIIKRINEKGEIKIIKLKIIKLKNIKLKIIK